MHRFQNEKTVGKPISELSPHINPKPDHRIKGDIDDLIFESDQKHLCSER